MAIVVQIMAGISMVGVIGQKKKLERRSVRRSVGLHLIPLLSKKGWAEDADFEM